MITIERNIDTTDLRAAYFYMIKSNTATRRSNTLAYAAFAIIFLLMIAHLWYRDPNIVITNIHWLVLGVVFWIFFANAINAIYYRIWVRFWLAQKSVQSSLGKSTLEFHAHGANAHSPMGTSSFNWSAFSKAEFTENYLMVTLANGWVMPIRCIGTDDDSLREVCKLIEAHAAAKN